MDALKNDSRSTSIEKHTKRLLHARCLVYFLFEVIEYAYRRFNKFTTSRMSDLDEEGSYVTRVGDMVAHVPYDTDDKSLDDGRLCEKEMEENMKVMPIDECEN